MKVACAVFAVSAVELTLTAILATFIGGAARTAALVAWASTASIGNAITAGCALRRYTARKATHRPPTLPLYPVPSSPTCPPRTQHGSLCTPLPSSDVEPTTLFEAYAPSLPPESSPREDESSEGLPDEAAMYSVSGDAPHTSIPPHAPNVIAPSWSMARSRVAVPRNVIFSLVKDILMSGSFKDVTRIPAPAWTLEPRSLLEKISDMFVHAELLSAMFHHCSNGAERMMRVARWYLSAYHVPPDGLRKPYNPILGETFECVIAGGTRDEVLFTSEQVSHHPPTSAFNARHVATGGVMEGHYTLSARVVTPNTGALQMRGRLTITFPDGDEVTVTSWPQPHLVGILTGDMRVEAIGDFRAVSRRTGALLTLSFLPKPFFGSSKGNRVVGAVSQDGTERYVVEGRWSAITTVRDVGVGEGAPEVLFDATADLPPRPVAIPSLSRARPSRDVWRAVSAALVEGDAQAAQKAKEAVELAQRAARGSGVAHRPLLFVAHEDDWVPSTHEQLLSCSLSESA